MSAVGHHRAGAVRRPWQLGCRRGTGRSPMRPRRSSCRALPRRSPRPTRGIRASTGLRSGRHAWGGGEHLAGSRVGSDAIRCGRYACHRVRRSASPWARMGIRPGAPGRESHSSRCVDRPCRWRSASRLVAPLGRHPAMATRPRRYNSAPSRAPGLPVTTHRSPTSDRPIARHVIGMHALGDLLGNRGLSLQLSTRCRGRSAGPDPVELACSRRVDRRVRHRGRRVGS